MSMVLYIIQLWYGSITWMFPKLALKSDYSVTVACANGIAVFAAGNGSVVFLIRFVRVMQS